MKIGVVGLGLIGGSIARGLVSSNQGAYEVVVFDADAAVQAEASAEGFVVAASLEQIWESTDLVFLATPIGVTLGLLGDLGADGPVITDVCSVKRSVMQAARDSNLARFIGGHPMAGSHRAGWSAGDEGLLRGAVWALVLEEATELAAWAEVAQAVLALGARIAPVTAAAHDRAVGGVSHAAHVVAAAYANSLTRVTSMPLALTLAAGSFRDLTRVTLSPESRTAEMLVENALAAADRRPQDIDAVVLVGGSTRVPAVSALLKRMFGKEPIRTVNPDEAVALGASIQAAMILADRGQSDLPAAAKSEIAAIQLSDVTNHSYGTISLDEVGGVVMPRNSIIIAKNTPIPHAETKSYYTVVDGQTQMNCEITQGEDDDPRRVAETTAEEAAVLQSDTDSATA
jgi:prephenate dehydrogenase